MQLNAIKKQANKSYFYQNETLKKSIISLPFQSFLGKLIIALIAIVSLSCSSTHKTVSQNNSFEINGKTAEVYATIKDQGEYFKKSESATFTVLNQPLETEICVFVDPNQSFQTFIGIGAALTDAAAETFAKLPKVKQDEFLKAYFDKNAGLAYTLARTNINSCDFSSEIYSYVADQDTSLKTFSLQKDEQFKIPLIKAAQKAAGNNLNLFVSPWSPPAWMKDNNDMLHGGKLKADFFQAWANYYVKFINGYEAMGIPIWGLTVQNEPMAKQKWESCIYTAEEERDFIKNYLGPTLKRNNLGTKKLIGWDHNRDLIYQRASTILSDPEAAKYVWGIGFHWYETWTGSAMQFYNLQKVKEAFPDKHLIFTEGCAERFDAQRLNSWDLGEKYAHSMVHDFNNGTVAWTDWNILLDEKGGPNHVENYCFAPVHANTKTGELIYTNAYYYIGHFSKFIKPGAVRIQSSANRDKLEVTAFKNQDGSLAVIVLNQTDTNISYKLWINGYASTIQSEAHSIKTLMIK